MPIKKITKEDKEWSAMVKVLGGNQCAVCGSKERLNSHHLIPKEISEYRHDIINGICLCPKHHRFSFKLSAHQNPIAFLLWLENNHPILLKEIKEKIKKIS